MTIRNALRRAETLLLQNGMSDEQAPEFLKDVQRHLDDPKFWEHPADGLAVFTTGDQSSAYHLQLGFDEAVYVEDHYVVGPMIHAFMSRFLVLALSENAVQLHLATANGLSPVAVNLPAGMQKDLDYDEPEAQIHAISGGRFRDRTEGSVFHGQGASTKHKDAGTHTYCHDLCAALAPVLAREGLPLLVAATDRLAAVFREVCSDPRLTPTHVSGCPDHWSREELNAKARCVFGAWRRKRDAEDANRLMEKVGKGRAASQPETVLRAASEGRVHELFVTQGAELRGAFQQNTGETHLAPRGSDGDDLLEYAIQETLRHGGEVRSVQEGVLTNGPIAASLRFAGS